MKKLCLSLSLALLFLSGCSTVYKPAPREREYFSTASRDIAPSLIRESFEKYKNTRLAYAGIILDMKTSSSANSIVRTEILVEHRKFDWVWDSHGVDGKHYYLSPNGEGRMKIAMAMNRPTSPEEQKQFDQEFAKGNMIVFYVKPKTIDKEAIVFDGYYAKGIPSSQFSTNAQNYPGENGSQPSKK